MTAVLRHINRADAQFSDVWFSVQHPITIKDHILSRKID